MDYLKGTGAQIHVANRFSKFHISTDAVDGIDEELLNGKPPIQVFKETPKKALVTVDIGIRKELAEKCACYR